MLLPAAQVNSLTSFKTELPYEYYTMPFCKPPEGVQRIANSANLGTVLMGLRIENSVYNFTMLVRRHALGTWNNGAGTTELNFQQCCQSSPCNPCKLQFAVHTWTIACLVGPDRPWQLAMQLISCLVWRTPHLP